MTHKVPVGIAAASLALSLPFGLTATSAQRTAAAMQVPRFQVDPFWPRPLPNHWILGSVTGVSVDAPGSHLAGAPGTRLAHGADRGRSGDQSSDRGIMLRSGAAVLEFDQSGALLSSWGGPGQGYEWPRTPAGISVDAKGNVWIAGIAQTPADAAGQAPRPASMPMCSSSAATGKFLLQIGRAGKNGRQLQPDHAQQARRRER